MRNGNMEDFRTKMSESWAKAQAELRKKAPEKYAEIEKLQSTNLLEAMNKMRELAAEQGIELPGNRMRGGMMDARRGFDGGNRGPRGDMMRGRRGTNGPSLKPNSRKSIPKITQRSNRPGRMWKNSFRRSQKKPTSNCPIHWKLPGSK